MLCTEQEWNALPKPPTKTSMLVGKHITYSGLSRSNLDLFQESFPRFFSNSNEDHALRAQWFEAQAGFKAEKPYNMRRYSGGNLLPRQRYYSLCIGNNVNSNQTLACELKAYAYADRENYYDVFDAADPVAAGMMQMLSHSERQKCAERENKYIIVYKRPLVVDGVSVIKNQIDADGIGKIFLIPYDIKRMKRDNILDLREKDAMEWFVRMFWDVFPDTLFAGDLSKSHNAIRAENGEIGPLVVTYRVPKDGINECIVNNLEVNDQKLYNFSLSKINNSISPMLGVIQFIMNPSLGGTAIDDAIACVLRKFGVDALVYPSARHDCGAFYEGDSLRGSIGWNFVDYKGIKKLNRNDIFVIFHPQYYMQGEGAYQIPASFLGDDQYKVDDWMIHGLAARQREIMIENAWSHRLSRLEAAEVGFEDAPLVIQRSPWVSYAAGAMHRKAREFKSWLDLRIAIASGEVNIDSLIENSNSDDTVGEIVEKLSDNSPIWGVTPSCTLFDKELWFLMQKSQSNHFRMICIYCGEIQEEELLFPNCFMQCYSCGRGGEIANKFSSFDGYMDHVERAIDRLDAKFCTL